MQKNTPYNHAKQSFQLPRRQFVKATGAAAISGGVWSEVAAKESRSANEKLKSYV